VNEPARSDGEAKLEPEALARLERQGGRALVEALSESFRTRTPTRLEEARGALAAGRFQDVERIFHSLKSSAALIGAPAIRDAARDAEAAAKAERADDVARLATRIERIFDALRPQLDPQRNTALPRIALVEDNEDNRLLVTVMLGGRFSVEAYADGETALEGIRADPPAAVLLDVSLPGMDGLEILARLRAEPSFARLPILAVTAHAMTGDRERLLEAGFDDYVAKPILDEQDLIARVQRLLDRER